MTPEQSSTIWLIQLVSSLGLSSYLLFSVIFSIYKLKSEPSGKNAKRNVWLNTGVSFFYAVSIGYIALGPLSSLAVAMKNYSPDRLTDYQAFLNSIDRSAEELVNSTNILAQRFYVDSGKIVQVINPEGLREDFIPSKKNIESRKYELKMRLLIDSLINSLKNTSVFHTCIFLVSIVLGMYSVSIVRAYNKLFKRDK